jgi:N-acetylglucosaminyl-diphospho-decaprenol L-rhamnosyltransferase
MDTSNKLTLSVVSHNQGALIKLLLDDLAKLPQKNFDVLITLNLPEDESVFQGYPFPLRVIRNDAQKGFGANHNAAFRQSSSQWFAIVNPDIRIKSLDLNALISPFQNEIVAAVAPLVISSEGKVEDSARRFPTLLLLLMRTLLGRRDTDYKVEKTPYIVDWVAGMFVVFRREAYQAIGGFDDRRFFMYFEDADICWRIEKKGWKVLINPSSTVIHVAQRASHRSLRHMRWHAVSAFRYLTGL